MRLLFFLLFLGLLGCADQPTAAPPSVAGEAFTLARLPNQPAYWTINGEPTLLLGASNHAYPFLAENWQEDLNYLHKTGGNYVRFALPSFGEPDTGMSDWDLGGGGENHTQALADFWDQLEDYLRYARSIGVVVEIDVWDHDNITAATWRRALLQAGGVRSPYWRDEPFLAGEHPFLSTVPGSLAYRDAYEALLAAQTAFVDRLLDFSAAFPNIIYNVSVPSTAYIPWMVHWGKYIEQRANLPSSRLVLGTNPRPGVSVASFSRDLLQGRGEAFHRPPPYGNGMSGLALTSIRGVRVVERRLKFWDLRPADDLLEADSPATAATDGRGNYLIYLPSAGSVRLSPDWPEQRPVRVTVVGYLGTQRSELLQPPYGDDFTLYTEEERGGWMILMPE